jgi:hypothetical protein
VNPKTQKESGLSELDVDDTDAFLGMTDGEILDIIFPEL